MGGVIRPGLVSAALVTRGDVDMGEILDSIEAAGVRDVVVWNNRDRGQDLQCYGRFAAVAECANDWIYTQDDDLVAPVSGLLAEVDPDTDRGQVVANNRADEEWRLLGIGSVFHRSLVEGCFDAYTSRHGFDTDFCRVADVVFAYQHPYRRVVLGYRDLPWGFHTAENPRMYGAADHVAVRERARARTINLAEPGQST